MDLTAFFKVCDFNFLIVNMLISFFILNPEFKGDSKGMFYIVVAFFFIRLT